MRAAHLRGGAGGSGRRIPSKAERDATRASRIADAYDVLGKFAGKKAAGLRRANPEVLKAMPSRREGYYADTGKPFKAGDTIHYGTRKGADAPGAYQRPGNRRVETINFKDLSKKSTRTSQAAARAAEDVKESFTTQRLKTGGYRGTPLRGEDRAKELKYRSRRRQKIYEALSAGGLPLRTPRQVLGLRFMETYREIPRPRWQP